MQLFAYKSQAKCAIQAFGGQMESDIIKNIQDRYAGMSKGQKCIADYIVNNYDKAAFMTAGVLGRNVGVSESTVVRFACMLGFEGYPDLQKNLQEIIKNKLTNVQRLNLMDGMSTEMILDAVLKQDIANLKRSREQYDPETIDKIAELLLKARNIYVLGYRSSAPLADFFVYYLSYALGNIRKVSQRSGDVFAQLVHANKDDVVVGIGFPRYSNQTVNGLEFAKKRGAKIITITDNTLSPLYELADLCMLAKSDMNSFVDSFVAPLSIINAILIVVGLKKKDELLDNFLTLEKIWSKNNIYACEDRAFEPVEMDD